MSLLAKKVLFNTLSGHLRLLGSFLVLFFLTPFILKKIGADGYGLWSLTFSILSFFELLDFGFALTVIKYVAECEAQKNIEKRNGILSTVLSVYLVLAVIGMLGIGMLVLAFNSLFSFPEAQQHTIISLLLILGCRSMLLNLPFSVFRGILFGEQKIYLTNTISLCSSCCFGLLGWQALEAGQGILGLAVANLITGLLENGAYLVFAVLLVPNLKFSYRNIDKAVFKTLFSFSSAQFVSNLSNILAFNSDLIIIKFFMSFESVGLYAIPMKIVSYGYIVIKQFTSVLTPVICDMHATEQKERLRSLFLHGTKYALIVATAFAVPGIIFASELIDLWVGAKFAAPMGVLIVLLLSMWMTSTQLISSDILQLSGYHRLLAKYAIIVIIGHLVASITLVVPLGLVGVALGALAGSIIGFFTDFRKVCFLYQISFAEFNQKVLSKLLLPLAAQSTVLLIMKSIFPTHSLFELFLINIPGALSYALVIWFYSLNENEKTVLTGAALIRER